jgi:hypothetical protein
MRRLLLLALALILLACHATPSGPTTSSAGPPVAVAAALSTPAMSVPAWYVDPADATGCASDSNTCQSATCGGPGIGPCITYGQVAARWGTNTPLLPQSTTLSFLSDQTAGIDLVDVRPRMQNWNQWLTVQGTLLQQATATIGTFTARNRAAGTTNHITASGQSGSYWAAFVGDLVIDTTQSTQAYFWIVQDLGSATAEISEPVPTPGPVQFPALGNYATIANGDALTIYRPSKLNCFRIGSSDLFSTTTLTNVTCTGLGASRSYSMTGLTSSLQVAFDANQTLDACSLQSRIQRAYNWNDYIAGGSGPAMSGFWIAGAVKASFPTLGCSWHEQRSAYDGDILIEAASSIHLTATTTLNRVYFGPSVFLDSDGSAFLNIGNFDSLGFFGSVAIWGPGQIDAHDRADIVCNGGCTTELLLTGGLTMNNGTQSTAFPWQASTRTWGAAVPISGPAIDDAGALCDPGRGNCYRTRY